MEVPAASPGRQHRLVISGFMAGAVSLLMTVTPVQAAHHPAPADPGSIQALRLVSQEGAALTHSIGTLTPYVHVAPGGLFVLEAPAAVIDSVPARHLAELSLGITILNAKINSGALATTASGRIYVPGLQALDMEDGRTGVFINWWGYSYCMSHADLVNYYQFGFFVGAAAAVAALFAGWAGVGVAVIAAWFVAMDWGNGACANTTWAGGLWMSPQ